MLILTVNGLKVLGPVLAQGPVSWLTVNNPSIDRRTTTSSYQSQFDLTSINSKDTNQHKFPSSNNHCMNARDELNQVR